jgi:enamine deaminase RidA (YjgF/YER057c/UK114 family)
MDDVAQMIVYLRDTADYHHVADYMQKHHPDIPQTIVYAPVCRPGWLVEVECIAIKKIDDARFPPF